MIHKYIAVHCVLMGLTNEARNVATRVCVIGAGVGGLTSARYLKEEGINFTVLEATNYVGGTWRYEEKVGTDEYGQPVYTSMYKHLRTNLPKPTMELPGFPIPKEMPSYIPGQMYQDYLSSYAKYFDIERYIKFLHSVTAIKRIGNLWNIKYKHVPTGNEFEDDYDYVIIATGHHSKPHMPNIPGEKLFKGTIKHSHDYRKPDPYKCRRVLVIGAGPSGMDITLDVAHVSKSVLHSHHSVVNFRTPFPSHYTKKPDVKEFNETGAIFVDGTYEEIDDVLYCTGFEYHYPFLDESCGLNITTHSVTPLYKYLININQPTMMIMGALVRACLVIAIDAQARYATALIKGNFTLPAHEEMMDEWQKRYDALRASGRPLSNIHLLGEKENHYYEDLSKQSGIFQVPPVMYKIRAVDTVAKLENLYTYRNYVYKVIDNETYTRTLIDNTSPDRGTTCSSNGVENGGEGAEALDVKALSLTGTTATAT